jgi:hypothetical protein
MIAAMLGCALFALICLIIAAGAVLPMYPRDVEGPVPLSADPALLIANSLASGCRDCAPGQAHAIPCRAACECDGGLAPAASHGAALSSTVYLIVGRPAERWWLAFKLPAI